MLLDVHAHPPALWRSSTVTEPADVQAYLAGLERFGDRLPAARRQAYAG